MQTHKQLWKAAKKLPQDYEPYGKDKRWDEDPKRTGADCSCGCRYYAALEDYPCDWGVCCNPKSHRCGLLTFEHQGCPKFVNDAEADKKFNREIREAKKHGSQK